MSGEASFENFCVSSQYPHLFCFWKNLEIRCVFHVAFDLTREMCCVLDQCTVPVQTHCTYV